MRCRGEDNGAPVPSLEMAEWGSPDFLRWKSRH